VKVILGGSSDNLGTCVGLKCFMILFSCFEDDIQSTVQRFAEYCKLSVFIGGVVFQYIYT